MNTEQEIKNFFLTVVGTFEKVEPVLHDASARRYFRIYTADTQYIACYDEQAKHTDPESYSFLIVYNLFRKQAIPIPEIFTIDFDKGFILQQDLGDQLLEQAFHSMTEKEQRTVFEDCIHIITGIQCSEFDGSLPFHLKFDVPKLMFEFEFFIEHALRGHFKADLSATGLAEIKKICTEIAEKLNREELFVVNHRDYHCRNILLMNNKPHIIDFQDARLGLPHYDLVSLLRDPYLELDESLFHYLYAYYYDLSTEMKIHSLCKDEFAYYFDLMAFQRLVKAIGTYGFQTQFKGTDRYVASIDLAVAYLREIAPRQPLLDKCWNLLAPFITR